MKLFEIAFLTFILKYCKEDFNDENLIGMEFKIDPNSFDFKSDFCRLIGLYIKETFEDQHAPLYKSFNKNKLINRLKELTKINK